MKKNLPLSTLFSLSLVSDVRRNHALEHATMQILGEHHEKADRLRLVGRSSPWGFYVYGDVSTEDVLAAAQEGLRRLKAGQRQMAIHPNCGSNFVVAGAFAALGVFLALGGVSTDRDESRLSRWLERIARFPLACAAATLGIIIARPLGAIFQSRVTTEADVGDLRIVDVARDDRAGVMVHFIRTDG